MNKRIRNKKAKQAELQRQQEFEELLQNPEQIHLTLQAIATVIDNVSKNISIAFANVATAVKRWEEQAQVEFGGDD